MMQTHFSDFAEQYNLTPRETELLYEVAVHGYTNEQLADVLEIQYKTAVNHMAKVLNKTESKNSRELLAKLITTLLPEDHRDDRR